MAPHRLRSVDWWPVFRQPVFADRFFPTHLRRRLIAPRSKDGRLDARDITSTIKALLAKLGRGAIIALWVARELLRTAWGIARGPLITALNIVAALVVLFEEWGWRPLSDAIAWLARFAPVALLERWIAGLPPYGALAVFALPAVLIFPLKLIAVWLLANGHFATATFLFVGAKVVSTALVARIFLLTKPTLMLIPWFARAFNWFVPWKDALFVTIRASWVWRYSRMLKTRVRAEVGRAWTRLRPEVETLWRRWTGRDFPVLGSVLGRVLGPALGKRPGTPESAPKSAPQTGGESRASAKPTE